MEGKEQDKILAFDALFTTNHIQMMKVLMTYLEPSVQRTIAIYIKLMELQYTLSFFRMHPNAYLQGLPREDHRNTEKLLDEMLPYCAPSQKEQFLQMKNTFQSLHQMQEMMEMVQSMKELFPEGEGPMQGDLSDLLSGLTAPKKDSGGGSDLSQIINLFQAMKE